MKKNSDTSNQVLTALQESPTVHFVLKDFTSKHPDIAQVLHASGLHIESLERIIERQEKRIEKLVRENEKLKAAGAKR